MTVYNNVLTPELFRELFQSVGWEAPGMEQIETALNNSVATFCAFDGEKAVSLELISSKGKEPFYEKFGFEQRPCDWDGAGMFKMLRKEGE